MGEFKKLNVKVFGKNSQIITPDNVYWKQLGEPVLIKEFGPIDYVDFSPIEPHHFAITSSVRVQVYNPVTRLVYKNLSKFQKNAYGATFRNDGKLICAGSEENCVKLFDVSSKSLLRVFTGHTSPVHRSCFAINNVQIVSFSDDQTVSLWDIAGEKRLNSYHSHKDYVRAGTVSPVSDNIILSGGYDNVVVMYDTRFQSCVLTCDHGAPVESILFLPTGGLFVTAGGTEIKVWDALSGGRLLTKLVNHHKTVTCLKLASKGTRFMSASLDRHVNVFDVSSFKMVHSLDFPNSILSLGISANDETLVAGMVDGVISVSRRNNELKPTTKEKKRVVSRYTRADFRPRGVDLFVPDKEEQAGPRYDLYLKKFRYTKALSCVLSPYVTNKNPHTTVAVLRELMHRNGLEVAIAGRENKTLLPLLRFLIKHIGDGRFTRVLIDVTNIFLDEYEDKVTELDKSVVLLLKRLTERLREEVELTQSLLSLHGVLQLITSVSLTTDIQSANVQSAIKPSQNAQDFVVQVS